MSSKEEIASKNEEYISDFGFGMTKEKAIESMDEYAKQECIGFSEWINSQEFPTFYGYRGDGKWEKLKPVKKMEDIEYVTTEQLYDLYLASKTK